MRKEITFYVEDKFLSVSDNDGGNFYVEIGDTDNREQSMGFLIPLKELKQIAAEICSFLAKAS